MNIPTAPGHLQQRCPIPELTGDKGLDAVNHRTALANCNRKIVQWIVFYRDIKARFNNEVREAEGSTGPSADDVRRETAELRKRLGTTGGR